MKKSKKIILRAIPVVIACFTIISLLSVSPVFAEEEGNGVPSTYPTSDSEGIDTINNLGGTLWSTITTVAQIAAFAAIIFAGIRYMFASADQKADIKKQTVILVVGAVLVFGASIVVRILTNILGNVNDSLQ